MPTMITVGRYLAHRLRECGVDHLFGLPGDFNLALLDEMVPVVSWVGSTNELNAAYAADGYARRRGLGALVTTYGVGELSAINGVAGSAAESVPVVQITGAPSTAAAVARSLLHHTLADGDFDHFSRAYAEVTAGGCIVATATAPEQIDDVLRLAVREQKPVYVRIPTDVATALVPSSRLLTPLDRAVVSDSAALSAVASELRRILDESDSAVVLVGHLAARLDVRDAVRQLADSGRVSIATLLDAKGLLSEDHPASLGTYVGALTPDRRTREAVESASTVITIGVVLTDLLTGMFTHRLGSGHVISIGVHDTRVDDTTYAHVALEHATAALVELVGSTDAHEVLAVTELENTRDAPAALTQHQLWSELQAWIPAGTPVIADAGTAFYGAAGLRMTGGTELIGQPIWSSIGYALPATLGIGLADSARPVLLIGDGAAQLTIQELSTIGREGVCPVIVLINNAGYTVERVIRSPEAVYQDVAAWNWMALVAAFLPGVPVITRFAGSATRLREALAEASRNPDRLVFIEAITAPLDVPPLLAAIGEGLGAGGNERALDRSAV